MSNIKIYGVAQSRAFRVLWCAKELGIDFDAVAINGPELKTSDFRAVNPNCKIPALVDGNVHLFESMAINLYLGRKYGTTTLWPKTIEDEGQMLQWSFWAISEVEKPLLTLLADKFMTAPEKRNAQAVEGATDALKKLFAVLDQALAGRSYLLGDDFTLADLNVASVLSWAKAVKFDFSSTPNVAAWLDRCLKRPAVAAARAAA